MNICLLTVFLYQYYTFLFLQNKIYFCYRGSHIIYLSSFTSPFFIEILIMKFRVWFELFQVQEQIFLPSLSSFRIVRMLKITTFKITGLNRVKFEAIFCQRFMRSFGVKKSVKWAFLCLLIWLFCIFIVPSNIFWTRNAIHLNYFPLDIVRPNIYFQSEVWAKLQQIYINNNF